MNSEKKNTFTFLKEFMILVLIWIKKSIKSEGAWGVFCFLIFLFKSVGSTIFPWIIHSGYHLICNQAQTSETHARQTIANWI